MTQSTIEKTVLEFVRDADRRRRVSTRIAAGIAASIVILPTAASSSATGSWPGTGGVILGGAIGWGLYKIIAMPIRRRTRKRSAREFLQRYPEVTPAYFPALKALIAARAWRPYAVEIAKRLPMGEAVIEQSKEKVVTFGETGTQLPVEMQGAGPSPEIAALAAQALGKTHPLNDMFASATKPLPQFKSEAELVAKQNPNSKITFTEHKTEGGFVKTVKIVNSASPAQASKPAPGLLGDFEPGEPKVSHSVAAPVTAAQRSRLEFIPLDPVAPEAALADCEDIADGDG